MYKTMLKILYLIVFSFVAVSLVACSDAREPNDISGRWTVEQVVYEDGSTNNLEAGNFVDISADEIVEVIRDFGNRQYPYTREGNELTLTTNDEQIVWQVVVETDKHLELATPIGKYVLTR